MTTKRLHTELQRTPRSPSWKHARRSVLAITFISTLIAACARRPLPTPDEPAEPATPAAVDTTPAIAPVEPQPPKPPKPPKPPRPQPSRSVRVCFGGDVLLGNNLDTRWAERAAARLGRPVDPFPDPDSLLSPLRSLVWDADVVLLNIEGAIGSGDAPRKCAPGSTRCYAFRQPTGAASALGRFARPAVVVGNVANNHAMDAGEAGFLATIEHLSAAGVRVTGADTLATPVIIPAGPDTVAALGFSVFRAGPDPRDLQAVRRHVARAAARYSRLIVTMHMGAEGRGAQRTPDATEVFIGEDRGNSVAFARAAIEAGATLVVGHGPHVLRAVEWSGDALIFYSLGNLLTYGPFNMREPLNRGAVACVTLNAKGQITDPVLRSTWQQPPGHVSWDPTARGAQLVDSLSHLDFPETAARVTSAGVILRPRDRSKR